MTLTNKALRVYRDRNKAIIANSGGTVTAISTGDTDAVKMHGFLATRNAADDSMYIPVADSSGYERGVKLCYAPVLNNGGYFDAVYANVKVASSSTPGGTVRGLESKATIEGNMASSAEAHAIMGKVNVAGTGGQVDTAVGVESLIETEASGAITTAYGFRASAGTAMNATTAIGFALKDAGATTKWDLGIDFNGVTFDTSGKEIRGRNAETISNATDGAWDFGAANLVTTGRVIAPYVNDTDTDVTLFTGIFKTRNLADSSMYVPVADSSVQTRGFVVAYAPAANAAGYFDNFYTNVKVNASMAGAIRASEHKVSVTGTANQSGEVTAVYAKINVETGATAAKAIGLDVEIDPEGSATVTSGVGIRVNGGTKMHTGIDLSSLTTAADSAVKLPFVDGNATVSIAALESAFGTDNNKQGIIGQYQDNADAVWLIIGNALTGKYQKIATTAVDA